MRTVIIKQKNDKGKVIKEKTVNCYEAEKSEDIISLVGKLAYEVGDWRYTHDYKDKENKKGRFNHYFAGYPVSFDTEFYSAYINQKGKVISNDEVETLIEKEVDKQKTKKDKLLTRVREKEKYQQFSTVYEWTMAFGTNDIVIVGRTWQSWIELLAQLKMSFKLDEKHTFDIWVHNLRCDWSFFKNFFKWDKKRTFVSNDCVYYATTEQLYYDDPEQPLGYGVEDFTGFCFRDSLILSGVKLENLHEIMGKYADNCFKLKGYDYEKPRHSCTPLNNDELAYAICDVLALNWYIQEKLEEESDDKGFNINHIALTETQEVKRACSNKVYYNGGKVRNPNSERAKKYRNYMDEIHIDFATYQQIRRAFQGGFAHANRDHVSEILTDKVVAADIVSSYIASIVMSKEYPISPYKLIEDVSFNDFNYYLSNYSCLFDVTLYDVRPKIMLDVDNLPNLLDFDHIDNIISMSKLKQYGIAYPHARPVYKKKTDDGFKWYENNGRLRCADRISMSINHLDWKMICRFYDFDKKKTKIDNFRIAKKGYLPKPIIEYVMQLFRVKCMFPEESIQYRVAKRRLNSIFGMIAYNILKQTYFLNNNNVVKKNYAGLTTDELNDILSEDLKGKSSFICYSWSHILTSESRTALLRLISEGSKYNHVLCDTDCDMFIDNDFTRKWIERYNDDVDIRMNQCFKYYGLPKDWHKVKTDKGLKCLGYFDYKNDGKPYKKFVTCGAKRYLYEDEKGNHITCSGLTKTAIEYLEEKYGEDLYNVFGKGEIKVDKYHAGRLIATYIEYSVKGKMTDYLGNTRTVSECSCVHFEKTHFDMKMCKDFGHMEDINTINIFENWGGY